MKLILKPYKAISWNTLYRGGHWTIRQRVADHAHQEVAVALQENAKKFKVPVDIKITAYLNRIIDPDNLCSKIIIDGLKGKIIEDDTSKFVNSVTTMTRKAASNFVEIEITEADISLKTL